VGIEKWLKGEYVTDVKGEYVNDVSWLILVFGTCDLTHVGLFLVIWGGNEQKCLWKEQYS